MSDGQRKKFFALLNELGIDKKAAEERAMEKYQLKKFTEISAEQMNAILTVLEKEKRKSKHTHGDREYSFRIYDQTADTLYYLDEKDPPITGLTEIPLNGKWFIGGDGERHAVHVMEYTGRKDENGVRIYDYDFIRSPLGRHYTVQYSIRELQWLAYEFDSDEAIALSILPQVWKIGSIYEGILEER